MDLNSYLIFVPIALLSICSPGPATILAISNSLSYGFARVNYSTIGNVAGQLIVASLAMQGVGALLRTSEALFETLKIIGAMYLIYLGIKQWRSRGFESSRIETIKPQSNRQIMLKGFVLALSNPKDIFFFTALLPQFINVKHPLLPQFSILILSFMFFSYISLMVWAFMAHSVRHLFSKQERMTCFNRVTGSVFVLLGLGILRLRRNYDAQ